MAQPEQPVLGPSVVTSGLGAFDALEFLGRGTFGETYRAIRGEDEYALKVIHFPDMPEYLWEREVEALARIEHPNIVGFRSSGSFSHDGKMYPYLECEYIDGGTVKSHLDAGDQPESRDALRAFLTGLLAGAGEMHDLGVLHRDIKPANIGLRGGDWGEPVLLDFGLARVLDMSSYTDYPAKIGTELYMAPEQMRGAPARRRSDLFAVGVVTYEAGTGQHPFYASNVATVQSLHDRIKSGPPDDPRGLSDVFDDDVAEVTLRLLSFRPYERLDLAQAQSDLGNI